MIYVTKTSHKLRVLQISCEMIDAKLDPEFIIEAVMIAMKYEGAYDLMEFWSGGGKDKEKALGAIEELIDDKKVYEKELREENNELKLKVIKLKKQIEDIYIFAHQLDDWE